MTEPITPPATPPSDPPAGSPISDASSVTPGVTDDIFNMPEDVASVPASGTPETPAQPAPGEQVTPPEATPPTAPETPPAAPETPPETPPAAPPVTEKLWAGKYKNEAELRAGFVNLGGDPNKYDTAEKIEEAYSVRLAETTRVNQERAERERLDAEANAPQNTPEAITAKIMSEIDYTKLPETATAKDLVEMLIPAIVKNLPQPSVRSPEELAQEVQPILAKQAETQAALGEVEAEVPRLRVVTDEAGKAIPNPFRDAFAYYVQAQRINGTFNPNGVPLAQALKDSLKSFLSVSETVVTDKVNQQKTAAELKAAAGNPPEAGGAAIPQTKSPEEDILGGILEAHKDRKGKFGF